MYPLIRLIKRALFDVYPQSVLIIYFKDALFKSALTMGDTIKYQYLLILRRLRH